MKPATPLILACLAAVVLASAGCDYTRPMMYIDIVNRSGQPMRNLEVHDPTGIFGLAQLGNEQTHRRMAAIGTPCTFSVEFEDQTGKKYSNKYDLGAKCPTEVAFEVGDGMKVSERQVRP
jgi:hypothetical protein